jgi:hypothetical protein
LDISIHFQFDVLAIAMNDQVGSGLAGYRFRTLGGASKRRWDTPKISVPRL